MLRAFAIDELHHRRKSGGLSLPDRSHHKEKPLLLSCKHFQNRRQTKLADCPDLCWDGAKRNTDGIFLIKCATAETAFIVKIVREVNFPVCEKTLLKIGRDDLGQHPH